MKLAGKVVGRTRKIEVRSMAVRQLETEVDLVK
jgi:hypothetical protein